MEDSSQTMCGFGKKSSCHGKAVKSPKDKPKHKEKQHKEKEDKPHKPKHKKHKETEEPKEKEQPKEKEVMPVPSNTEVEDKEAEMKKNTVVRNPNSLPLSEFFGIRYGLVRTDGFDGYLRALGMGFIKRKFALSLVPTKFELNHYTGSYRIVTSSRLLSLQVDFRLDEEMDIKTPDGRECKVTFTYKPPDRLIEVQRGLLVNIVERQFSEESIETTLEVVGAATCMMYFISAAETNRMVRFRRRSRSFTLFHQSSSRVIHI